MQLGKCIPTSKAFTRQNLKSFELKLEKLRVARVEYFKYKKLDI